MAEVDVGSETHTTYADVDAADEYLSGSLHAGTTWDDASEANKGKALVTATRILDRQRWKSGYETFAARLAVTGIVNASIEMALALLDGADFQSEQSTAQKLTSIRAGSVSLTYALGTEGPPHRFPLIVHELLRDYLAGADLTIAPVATGVSGTSVTGDRFGHTSGF